ncbi:MAG: ribonuclease P protein component [Microgenomates group bacterium]
MLPKQNRLPLKTEFERVRKNGKLFQGESFSLLVVARRLTSNDQRPKFAFIISKKIHPRATKRNRAKRLLAEAVRVFLPQIRGGVEGVFLAKKAIVGKGFGEIKNEVEKVFQKAKII